MSGDICANRHGGNPESQLAFEKVKPTIRETHKKILRLFRISDLTSKEVAQIMGKPLNAISGRLSELKRMGLIFPTGERAEGAAVLRVKG